MTSEAAKRAASRSAAAERRIVELEELKERLAQGSPLTQEDATMAAEAVVRARVRRHDAAESAKLAHLRGAEQHERTAAAMDAAGEPELAEKQRQGAAGERRKADAEED